MLVLVLSTLLGAVMGLKEQLKNTPIYKLLQELINKAKETSDVFVEGNSLGEQEYTLSCSDTLLDICNQLKKQIVDYIVGNRALAETQQLTLDLI